MNLSLITNEFSLQYPQYKQQGLDKPQLNYDDIAQILEQHRNNSLFNFSQLGESTLGIPIWQIEIGTGDERILAWSQMHGNESTASAALMDFLNFLASEQQAAWCQQWLSKVKLRIIPMLNPDGAARASRLNAMSMDINRDASALQTPEGQLLMQAAKNFKPAFALNLHDQSRFYAVGDSNKTATISLLAPAFNVAKDINAIRKKAMQLIGDMHDLIQYELPGHLAKYNDTYSTRSFGDIFTGMGISTILIESGAYPKDDNRSVARKLNYQLLILSVQSIASQAYNKQSLAVYDSIPYNRKEAIKDVLITNLSINLQQHQAKVDLAIEFKKQNQAEIVEVGDLSVYSAFHCFDASGLDYQSGKAYPLTTALNLDDAAYIALLSQGYSHFTGDSNLLQVKTSLPVSINGPSSGPTTPELNQAAVFLMASSEGVQFAMLAGLLVNLTTGQLVYQRGT
ncbi:M14 family zinc carboxypeptidase [Rheinheimera sp. WS51]|uniref:M14 family zinc carboxypeptidase n=1 Tax=Rheinheimera sp. WS51 TaxID=3425886 RepID=UPI003D8DDC15